jgi:hypothetical protein
VSVNLTSDQLLWLRDYFKRRHEEGHRWVILPGLEEALKGGLVSREQLFRFITEECVPKQEGKQ